MEAVFRVNPVQEVGHLDVKSFTSEGRTYRLAILTVRESQVLQLLCLGFSNKQIASRLRIEVNTVRSHVSSILAAGDFDNRWHAGAWANRHVAQLKKGEMIPLDPSPLDSYDEAA